MSKHSNHLARLNEFSRVAYVACGYESSIDDMATAVHEGAHAVILRVLGLPCGAASIEGDNPHAVGGHGWLLTRVRVRVPELVEASIIVCMSGAVAERILLGRWAGGDEYDKAEIRKLAKITRWPGGRRAALERLRQRTHELVDRHRNDIRRVALALLQHRMLDGSAINGVLLTTSSSPHNLGA
jgi:hypothetical protein